MYENYSYSYEVNVITAEISVWVADAMVDQGLL